MALCEPAATELEIKKRSRIITDLFRSLFTDSFFDLSFDFDCTLTGQGGFKTDFV